MSKIIFIAMPTKGTAEASSAATGLLKEQVYLELARLHDEHPDYTFVAPMVQDYLLLKHLDKEPVWAVWGDRCRRLIERADEVWVLMFEGWDVSVGVQGELDHAKLHQRPVLYIEPRSL